MAATYQAAGQDEWDSAVSSLSFTPDGGTLEADVFVVAVVPRGSATVTPPAGAEVGFQQVWVAGDRYATVFAWAAPSDAPGPVSIPLSTSTTGAVTWTRWRGVDVSEMIDAVGEVDNWTVPAEAPSISTTVADAPILGGVILASGSREVDATSGWTERAFTGVTRNFMATRNAGQASPGPTGAAQFTVSGGEIDYVAWQLALTPDLSAPTLPSVDHAIVGAPQSDGFTVAAKISDATSARLRVASNAGLDADVAYSSSDTPDGDGYVSLTISGLPARARDYYAIEVTDGEETVTTPLLGSPLRVPAADTEASFTVGFGSCWDNVSAPGTPSFSRVLAHDPHLFFHLGDWSYDDSESTSQDSHRGDMEAQLSDGGLASLVASVPTVYVKSDHDGDANEQGPGVWTAPNRAATLQMFPYNTRPNANGLYHAFTVGRVRFIFIDTRYLGDNSTTRLGSTQKAWLKTEMERDEPLKVLVQDSTWITNEPGGLPGVEDDWATYNTERTELGDHWESDGVGMLITLHGDMHALAADDGSNNDWGGFPSFCAAPFRNESSIKTLSTGDWSHGVYPTSEDVNVAQYGTMTFADNGDYITATFRGYDTSDVVQVALTVGTEGYVPPEPITGTDTSGLTAPTGRWAKAPVQPVWWDVVNDEWRAILPTASGHRLYTLDPEGSTQGAVVDNRQAARVAAVHESGTTYVLRQHASSTLFSSFDSSWSEVVDDATVPLTPSNHDASPVALLRTSNGYLWAACQYSGQVRVTRSTNGGSTWSTPTTFSLSGTGVVLLMETGSTVVLYATANDGGGRLVRTISEGAGSIGSWTSESAGSLPSPAVSDDHASGVVLPDGRVFVVGKTGEPDSGSPLLYATVRSSGGSWSTHTIEPGPDVDPRFTRPRVTIVGSSVHVVYGSIEGGNDLSRRTMPLDAFGSWSSREVVLTGGDWSDSAVLPSPDDAASAPTTSYPILAHERADEEVWISWRAKTAAPADAPPLYLGTTPVTAMYLGTTPVSAMYVGSTQVM